MGNEEYRNKLKCFITDCRAEISFRKRKKLDTSSLEDDRIRYSTYLKKLTLEERGKGENINDYFYNKATNKFKLKPMAK